MGLSYSTVQTMATTNLQTLAHSATTAWQSAIIDNTTDLYEDILVQPSIDWAAGTPANEKAAFVFAYGGLNTTYSYPCTGSEGTFTIPAFNSNPQAFKQVGVVPYLVDGAIIPPNPFPIVHAFGGIMPPKWGLVVVNFSGISFAATTITWRGIKF